MGFCVLRGYLPPVQMQCHKTNAQMPWLLRGPPFFGKTIVKYSHVVLQMIINAVPKQEWAAMDAL